MSSRVRIAAAACLVASGLFVTGGSAALAFASPDGGASGDGGSSSSDGGTGGGTSAGGETGGSKTGGTTGTGTGTGSTTGSSNGSANTPATGGSRPTSTVGSGRDLTIPGLGSIGLPRLPSFGSRPTTPSKVSTSPTTATTQPSATPEGDVTTAPAAPAAPVSGAPATPELALPDVTLPAMTLPALAVPSLPIPVPAANPADAGQAADGVDATAPLPEDKTAGSGGTTVKTAVPSTTDPGATPAPTAEQLSWPLSWWASLVPTLPGKTQGSNGSLGQTPFGPLPQLPPLEIPLLGQVVPALQTITDPLLQIVTGLANAAADFPFTSLTLPVTLPSVPGAGTAPGAGGGGAVPVAPGLAGPRLLPAPQTPPTPVEAGGTPPAVEPPQAPRRTLPPATPVSNELLPAPTYRMGYVDYLRAAGIGQVAAVAVPGVTGILVLTGAGGLIGYRQARAGRSVSASGPARFMS